MTKSVKDTKDFSKKGALFIEYAVMLAFIVMLGVVFLKDSSLNSGITQIFTKVDKVLKGSTESEDKTDSLAQTLKHYASVFTSSAMDHYNDGTKSLGQAIASGAYDKNFANRLAEAGIDAAYIGFAGSTGYAIPYGKLSASEKEAFRQDHYLSSTTGMSSFILATDGNTTWENGKSYNAVQYMTYQGKNEAGKASQVIASYRNIVVNVDSNGQKTYTNTAGTPITVNSVTNDGGGWQKFTN